MSAAPAKNAARLDRQKLLIIMLLEFLGPLMAKGNPTLLLFLSELTDWTLTQI